MSFEIAIFRICLVGGRCRRKKKVLVLGRIWLSCSCEICGCKYVDEACRPFSLEI